MNIRKNSGFEVLTEIDFLREIQEKENQREKANSLYGISFTQINSPILNIHTDTKETEEMFTIERNPINRKYAITIAQNSIYKDVFLQSVLLLEKTANEIEAEIIIRSDDFKKGALNKNIIFKIQKNIT